VFEVGCENGFQVLDIDGLRLTSARGRREKTGGNEEVQEAPEWKLGLPAIAWVQFILERTYTYVVKGLTHHTDRPSLAILLISPPPSLQNILVLSRIKLDLEELPTYYPLGLRNPIDWLAAMFSLESGNAHRIRSLLNRKDNNEKNDKGINCSCHRTEESLRNEVERHDAESSNKRSDKEALVSSCG
jgi:hypothetical protein